MGGLGRPRRWAPASGRVGAAFVPTASRTRCHQSDGQRGGHQRADNTLDPTRFERYRLADWGYRAGSAVTPESGESRRRRPLRVAIAPQRVTLHLLDRGQRGWHRAGSATTRCGQGTRAGAARPASRRSPAADPVDDLRQAAHRIGHELLVAEVDRAVRAGWASPRIRGPAPPPPSAGRPAPRGRRRRPPTGRSSSRTRTPRTRATSSPCAATRATARPSRVSCTNVASGKASTSSGRRRLLAIRLHSRR